MPPTSAAPPPAPPGEHGRRTRAALDEAVRRLGGAPRAGQVEMADRVAGSLEAGGHLLVQAGTGTGKSLGYLVPVMVHVLDAGERAVVSTATLALQRQVLTRDAPLAADAVEAVTGLRPGVALLKGWQNYLCRHRLQGGYPDDDAGALFSAGEAAAAGRVGEASRRSTGEQVVRLREWAEQTATGDRDDLVPGVSDRAWAQVSVTRAECLGPTCPLREECFPELARAAAAEADVVVTNHAMLGIAAAGNTGVLPEHRVLVVDEAHELADRVRSQGTASLSAAAVMRVAATARRGASIVVTELESAGQQLQLALADLPDGRLRDGLPGLHGRADHRDSGAVLETVEHVGQHEVRGGATDVVARRPQAHLQEGSVEPDGAHARQGREVRVQEGPVVEP